MRSQFTGNLIVDGTKNVMCKLAGCCDPRPGDLITGYVSANRGVIVHRADCLTFQRIDNIEHRLVKVEWEKRQ